MTIEPYQKSPFDHLLLSGECLEDITDFLAIALLLKPESEARQAIGELRLTFPAEVLKQAAKNLPEPEKNKLRDWLLKEGVLMRAPLLGDRVHFLDRHTACVYGFKDDHYLLYSEEYQQKFDLHCREFNQHLLSNNQIVYWQMENKISDYIELEKRKYWYIETKKELEEAIAIIKDENLLAIDTETTGLDPHREQLRLIQIAALNKAVVIIDCFKITEYHDLEVLFNNSDLTLIGHNLKFDLKFLMKNGINTKCKMFDTMLASELIHSGIKKSNSLKEVTQEYIGITLDKASQRSDWSISNLSSEQLIYAAIDSEILLPLQKKLSSLLQKNYLTTVAEIEFACISAVAEMELTGMYLELLEWRSLQDSMNLKRQKAKDRCQQLYLEANLEPSLLPELDVINFDSPDQVKKALAKMGIFVKSTNQNDLIPLAENNPFIRALLEYRKLSKFETGFANSLLEKINPVTNRLHTDYQQIGAVSGRFSSREPNLQNIPRQNEVRQCFRPAVGNKIIIADYSQIELRIAAEIADDQRMIEAYQNGEDLHKLTASLILKKSLEEVTKEDRQIAKSLNFGLLYAMQAYGLKKFAETSYGVKLTEKQAKDFRTRFFEVYQGLGKWHEAIAAQLAKGSINETRTLANRRRLWASGEDPKLNEVVNLPVQGTSADITKRALSLLREALCNTGAKIIATVHDEIILEVKEERATEAAEILKQTMIAAGQEFLKKVPIEVEVMIASDWGEK